MNSTTTPAAIILDKALELAELNGWDALRLHTVADALQLSLDEIRLSYPQKDDLAEAWFDRADHAAVAVYERDGFASLPERIRGYGHIKERHIEEAKAREAALLNAFRNPAAHADAAD